MLTLLAESFLSMLDSALALASLEKWDFALALLRATPCSVATWLRDTGAASLEAKRRETLLASHEVI